MGDRQVRRGDSIPNPRGGNGTSAHDFVSSMETVTPPNAMRHVEYGDPRSQNESAGSGDDDFLLAGGCTSTPSDIADCGRLCAFAAAGIVLFLVGAMLCGCGPSAVSDRPVESTRIDPDSVPFFVYRFRDSLGNVVYATSGGGLFVVPDAAPEKGGAK